MSRFSSFRWQMRAVIGCTLALAFTFATSLLAFASVSIVQISTDPYTNSTSQHQTMVEPDTYSFGSTIVSAIQSGRFTDGGASNIGWATSTNGGGSWTNGFLPGTTVFATPAGPYSRVSDPTVAYDAAHNTWLIASLAISGSQVLGAAVIVNQSTNGGTSWSNPVWYMRPVAARISTRIGSSATIPRRALSMAIVMRSGMIMGAGTSFI